MNLEMIIFGLKMIVKSGLDFFILKLNEPLQRYLLIYQANSAFLSRFFLHWAVATLKELIPFQNKKILAHTVAVSSWSIANNFVIDFYCRCLEILRQIA